jgi:hypothetical protein
VVDEAAFDYNTVAHPLDRLATHNSSDLRRGSSASEHARAARQCRASTRGRRPRTSSFRTKYSGRSCLARRNHRRFADRSTTRGDGFAIRLARCLTRARGRSPVRRLQPGRAAHRHGVRGQDRAYGMRPHGRRSWPCPGTREGSLRTKLRASGMCILQPCRQVRFLPKLVRAGFAVSHPSVATTCACSATRMINLRSTYGMCDGCGSGSLLAQLRLSRDISTYGPS